MAGLRRTLRIVAVVIVLLGLAAAVLNPRGTLAALQVPLDALYSTTRMFLAFLLSLIFAIAYGTTAATNRRAAEIMLPVLDVLQSVPILGFFPIVLIFFASTILYPIGVEIAVVVLIFTSMAWNMAFGVYEALTTLPHDLGDAASVFGLRGWQRFRRLQFPAMVPKLVYNSMLSFTVGWFYLVASEVFVANGEQLARPGLGSYLYSAALTQNVSAILVGLGALTVVVLALDTFLWRPLSVWAERFRMDVATAADTSALRMPTPIYLRFGWLPRFSGLRHFLSERTRPITNRWSHVASRLDAFYGRHPATLKTARWVDLALFLVIFLIVVTKGLVGLAGFVDLLLRAPPPEATDIPGATLFSLGRLTLAYGICLAWTIPAAAWLGRSKRASRLLTPAIEVVASIPATALFPVLVLFAALFSTARGPIAEITALLIIIFAMQWYLLFNVMAGVRSIPSDLEEAAKAFGVRGRTYWRRVLLPAMMPSLLTGSITAWGAGWNALIVAEWIPFGYPPYTVHSGIGYLIDVATYGAPWQGILEPNIELLYLAILFMIIVVLAMNKLLWRPLIRRASVRYRYEV